MIKKIFVGVLLAGVFSLLVLGAVNRTLAKSDKLEPRALSAVSDYGNGTEGGYRNSKQLLQSEDYAEQGRNNKQASEERSEFGGGTGHGQDGRVGTEPGRILGSGQENINTWEDPITVVVKTISAELLIVLKDDGSELEIEGRSLRYMIENGFVVEPGDEIVLIGFFENDRFEIGSITNNTTSQTLTMRSETGRPLWAGGGRGRTSP